MQLPSSEAFPVVFHFIDWNITIVPTPTDAFVTKYSTVTCDRPQGKILAASDESEEGGQKRD